MIWVDEMKPDDLFFVRIVKPVELWISLFNVTRTNNMGSQYHISQF